MAREIDLGSIVGPKGDQGAKGDMGKSIGYATVEPASNAVAKANVNTASGVALNAGDIIVAPSGKLYVVKSIADPNYTVQDSTVSIKGAKGDPGTTVASGVSYGEDSNVEAALDDVMDKLADLMYEAINITSFTNSVNTVEMGSTVNTVVLNWNYNKTPAKLELDSATIDVSLKTKTYESAGIKANKTYTLKATDERGATSQKTTSITFLNGIYYGSAASASELNNTLILGLTKKLQSSKATTFTTDCEAGQKIFFAIPTRYGTPAFKVGGFDGGFAKAGTIEFTNASGYKESYDIWRSDNEALGNTTVVVS